MKIYESQRYLLCQNAHTKYQWYKISIKNDRLILLQYTQRNKEMTTPVTSTPGVSF